MKLNFFFLLLFFAIPSFAQVHISGTVEKPDNSILPYVNIGIKQRNIGTISNQNGTFSLQIPKQFLNDTLSFSYVGCEELNVPIRSILANSEKVFILKPEKLALREVVITDKKLKTRTIGIKSHDPFIFAPSIISKTGDIVEDAQLIHINKPSKVLSTSIFFTYTKPDTQLFRINFYNVRDGLPFQKVYDQNIFERIPIKKGWRSIDLSKYNITMDSTFFISVEFIPLGKKYTFGYGVRLGGIQYFRTSSLGTWEKQKGASLSLYVTVEQ